MHTKLTAHVLHSDAVCVSSMEISATGAQCIYRGSLLIEHIGGT